MSIVQEPYYICDVCGKKKPVSQMAGKCVVCGVYVCSNCAQIVDDKIYCDKHAPTTRARTGCFIATAAFGNPLANELNTLRSFRDEVMLTNRIGRLLVSFYYKISPPIASFISNKTKIRWIVRHCISPLINFLKKRGF